MKMSVLLIVSLACFGMEFDALFERAVLSAPALQAKHEKISASHAIVQSEITYKNPVISLGVNDMPVNENTFQRDLEPMQTQFIAISQEIETFGKLDLKESILQTDIQILEYELEDLKVQLYKNLALAVEKITTFESLIELLSRKKSNLETLAKYDAQSIGVDEGLQRNVALQKRIFDVQERILELEEMIQKTKHEFLYLAGEEFVSVEKPQIYEVPAQEKIRKSPKYKIFELKRKQLETVAQLEGRKKYSNMNVSLSYNHRQRFEDYVSVSTSFALPLYGKEDAQVKKVHFLKQEVVYSSENYIKNATVIFQNNSKKIEYMDARIENLNAIILKYKTLNEYDKSNIKNTVTLEKNIQNENILLDLEMDKAKYALEKTTAFLELFYLTQERL